MMVSAVASTRSRSIRGMPIRPTRPGAAGPRRRRRRRRPRRPDPRYVAGSGRAAARRARPSREAAAAPPRLARRRGRARRNGRRHVCARGCRRPLAGRLVPATRVPAGARVPAAARVRSGFGGRRRSSSWAAAPAEAARRLGCGVTTAAHDGLVRTGGPDRLLVQVGCGRRRHLGCDDRPAPARQLGGGDVRGWFVLGSFGSGHGIVGATSHPSSVERPPRCRRRRALWPAPVALSGRVAPSSRRRDAVGDPARTAPQCGQDRRPGGTESAQDGQRATRGHDYLVPPRSDGAFKAAGRLRSLPLPVGPCRNAPNVPHADQLHGPGGAPPGGRGAGESRPRARSRRMSESPGAGALRSPRRPRQARSQVVPGDRRTRGRWARRAAPSRPLAA